MNHWLLAGLTGILSGTFSAVFGVGSGILLIPMLIFFFSLPQKSAQGTCLLIMVPMALMGAIRYIQNPDIEINIRFGLFVAAFAVVGAFLGAEIAARVPGTWLRKGFAVFLLVVAAKLLLTPGKKKPEEADREPEIQNDMKETSAGGI